MFNYQVTVASVAAWRRAPLFCARTLELREIVRRAARIRVLAGQAPGARFHADYQYPDRGSLRGRDSRRVGVRQSTDTRARVALTRAGLCFFSLPVAPGPGPRRL